MHDLSVTRVVGVAERWWASRGLEQRIKCFQVELQDLGLLCAASLPARSCAHILQILQATAEWPGTTTAISTTATISKMHYLNHRSMPALP